MHLVPVDPMEPLEADAGGDAGDETCHPSVGDTADGLSAAQRDVLRVLGARPHERPVFDPRLRAELRATLEDELSPLAATLEPDQPLWVGKRLLTTVHGCQVGHLAAEAEPFRWSPAIARGVVAHKAIELSIHWAGPAPPGDLVDAAVERLVDAPGGLGDWLAALAPAERAELRSEAVDRVTKFLECFPPLEARWYPVAESRLRADLCGGRIVLSGKVDLTVGKAHGVQAGKVLIDLKTGSFSPHHRDDLRFYALVEALRLGTPPRLMATYYLDSGQLHEEPVAEALLAATVRRVVDGAQLAVELRRGEREPALLPSPACRWCPALAGCETGQDHLASQRERDGW